MTSLLSLPLRDVLDRIAAPTAAPGGGAAAALAGSLGAAVGAMVALLPRTRHGTPEERSRLDAAAVALSAHRLALAQLADADTAAVTTMMAAARANATAPEDGRRAASLEDAAREATRVPLDTARRCSEALEALRDVAACGARVARSDVLVAVSLLKASADGAASNVRANLPTLTDGAFVRDSTRQLTRALDGATRAAHDALAALQD